MKITYAMQGKKYLLMSLFLVLITSNVLCNTPCVSPANHTMLECFDNVAVGTTYVAHRAENTGTTGSSATVAVDPVNSANRVLRFVSANWGHYLRINVTLPCNRILNNYSHISFRIRRETTIGTNQDLRMGVNGTIMALSPNTESANLANWVTFVRPIPAFATALQNLNTFTLEVGLRIGTNTYFIDDIMLQEKTGLSFCFTAAPIALEADQIGSSSFRANWNSLANAETYSIDVATDSHFSNILPEYNNFNVGNSLSVVIEGLMPNTTYFYRVRGNRSGSFSPWSSTINLTTLTAVPVDPYIAPNLDPVPVPEPEVPTPTIGRFVIANFEANNINDPLLVNNTDRATATVRANPTNSQQKSAHIRITEWDRYLRVNVQLPPGASWSNYTQLSFDEYLESGFDHNFKDIRVFINGVQRFNVASGSVTPIVWTTRTFDLSGITGIGNTFTLDLGMRTANGSFFIDNITLHPSTTAPTALSGTNPMSNSFRANWRPMIGAISYLLDVSTNANFIDFVPGLQGLNVGNTHTHIVTGLAPSTSYFYRVRAQLPNEVTPTPPSNVITMATRPATAPINHFATRASGNISDVATWQSSTNNVLWINATAIPTNVARSIRVLKDHELTINQSVHLSEIIVRAGGKLNISNGSNLTLDNRIFLESNASDGTATVVNNGNISISGNAIVHQHLTQTRNWYFASPVSNMTSGVIKNTEGNRLWERNVAGNSWTEILTSDILLTPGRGYIARLNEPGLITFTGTLNDGTIQLPLTRHEVTSGRFHLVGNPYPSYLDWQSVAALNNDLLPVMWFRTKSTTGAYVFATVLVNEGALVLASNNANTDITRLIPPMQSFWVRMNNNVTNTNFTVNNAMRFHVDQAGNRLKAPSSVSAPMLRLEVSNGINIDEAVMYFNTNAANTFDRFDAPKMFNKKVEVPEIYTIVNDEKLVINGMNEYTFNTVVPLGFETDQTGSFSIRASQFQHFDSDTRIMLSDKLTNTLFDLTEGETYTFQSDSIETEDRFSVLFRSATGTTSPDNLLNQISVFAFAQQSRLTLQINEGLTPNTRVTVYNAMGQNVHTQSVVSNSTQLSKDFSPGVYLLQIENDKNIRIIRTLVK